MGRPRVTLWVVIWGGGWAGDRPGSACCWRPGFFPRSPLTYNKHQWIYCMFVTGYTTPKRTPLGAHLRRIYSLGKRLYSYLLRLPLHLDYLQFFKRRTFLCFHSNYLFWITLIPLLLLIEKNFHRCQCYTLCHCWQRVNHRNRLCAYLVLGYS